MGHADGGVPPRSVARCLGAPLPPLGPCPAPVLRRRHKLPALASTLRRPLAGFPYPVALTMWHMFFCAALAWVIIRLGYVEPVKMNLGALLVAVRSVEQERVPG